MATTLENVGVMGLQNAAEQNLVFGLLVSFIAFLIVVGGWFIKYLLGELKEARQAYSTDIKGLTQVVTQIETTLRIAVNK